MSNKQNILELLNKTPGLNAKDIARGLGWFEHPVRVAGQTIDPPLQTPARTWLG